MIERAEISTSVTDPISTRVPGERASDAREVESVVMEFPRTTAKSRVRGIDLPPEFGLLTEGTPPIASTMASVETDTPSEHPAKVAANKLARPTAATRNSGRLGNGLGCNLQRLN